MDNEEEQNSAEREAEEILSDLYPQVRAEECPQGEECPVHFRVDEEYFDEPAQYARLIHYIGEFCVVTEDNHELDNPLIIIKIMLGQIKKEDLPPRFETLIYHVGSEGVIGDLSGKPVTEAREALRYLKTHDNWNEIPAQHYGVTAMLEAGLIDVSKPWNLEK